MSFKKKKYIITLFLFVIFLSGCLKDNPVVPPDITFSSSEELVHYLEAKGDFINSTANPAVIEASEVFANIGRYLIVDIRSGEEFSAGHIEGSVNLDHKNLLNFFDSTGAGAIPKVVIVSRNGQSSVYYTSLIRMYGYPNVYSLNYGMASWHRDFADDWLFSIQIRRATVPEETYKENKFYDFPKLQFNKTSLSVEEKIKARISELIFEEFPEGLYIDYTNNSPSMSPDYFFTTELSQYYIVCFGIREAYRYGMTLGHIAGAIHYNSPPKSDIQSSLYLQTLPTDKKIVIYTYEGNLSASLAGYLRILGYDAVSLTYGINTISVRAMSNVPALEGFVFSESKIMNYPYVKE